MTGHRKWRDIRNPALDKPAHRNARAEIGWANDVALALGKLREERERSDTANNGAPQAAPLTTACITHPEGDYLTALRAYVEDLGGTLEIAAVFSDQRVVLLPTAEVEDEMAIHADEH